MKEQLHKLMEAEGMSPAKFADAIGVQRSSISHIISGRNKPSYDFIMKIMDRFKGINAEWLLTGQGSMIKGQNMPQPPQSGKNLFDGDAPGDQVIQKGSDNHTKHTSIPYSSTQETLEADRSFSAPKEKKEVKSTEFTNVNNVKYLLVFYEDGSFEQYKPRA